jgi:hypothetical protein
MFPALGPNRPAQRLMVVATRLLPVKVLRQRAEQAVPLVNQISSQQVVSLL